MTDITELIIKLIKTIGFIGLIVCLFALICLIGIKIKKLNYFHAIKLKELFIAFVFSAFVWSVFSITAGSVIWLCGYFLFRNVIFINDYKRLTELYEKHIEKDRPYPTVGKFPELKKALTFKSEYKISVDRLYFSTYLFTAATLLVLYFSETINITDTNVVLFFSDSFCVVTGVFIFLAKILYIGFYRSVRWVGIFQYSQAACIPVIAVGIFYYLLFTYLTVISWCNINDIPYLW